jgi:excisionase family DNA binding protein
MQAYATAEMAPVGELRLLDRRPAILDSSGEVAARGNAVLDELLGQLADLVAAKVAARLAAPRDDAPDEWLDSRSAAEYLGIHRDNLRRLAAAGSIPAKQAGAGCKLFFRRSDLDRWRCPESGSVVGIGSRRHGR